MGKARRKQIDPQAKRADETDLQWRSRLAREQETRRRQGEDIITPERRSKGDLEEVNAKTQGLARSYRKRSTSSLLRLCARGALTPDQLAAAQEISMEATRIKSDVDFGSSSAEARVDCSGSGRAYGAEHLHRVCIEQAYTCWRNSLPTPRGLVLDMVCEDHQLAAIARRYNRSWRKAMSILREALDEWPVHKHKAFQSIRQDDVDASNARAA